MKRLVIVLILLMSVSPAGAKHLYKESVYQQVWCDKHGGVTEYKLNDKTRVDCLTDKYAVELDFAPNAPMSGLYLDGDLRLRLEA